MHGQVFQHQALMERVPHRKPCPAFKSGHIAKTNGRIVYHESVPVLHTPRIIGLRQDDHFIGMSQDFPVNLPVF